MNTNYLTHVNGALVTSVRVTVPNQGAWFADVDFADDAPGVSGRVTLAVGALQLSGTIMPEHDGTFGFRRRCRIAAGAGAWGDSVRAKPYHNDARVRARTVAEDAAREVGETIGTFEGSAERVGVDYVRQSGPASRTLEDVAGGAPWWVDYAGVTHVGARPPTTPATGSYSVLDFDPRTRTLTLAADDLSAISIGSVISDERLDELQAVRELEIVVNADAARIYAWCGGSSSSVARLPDLFRAMIKRATDGTLFGKYRYRVREVAPDGRLNLQAVRKAVGLPDILPISVWPGVPGSTMKPVLGSEVLVEFIEGDRTMPIVSGFASGDGSVGSEIAFCGGTQPVARQGDTVKVLTPPAVLTGTLNGTTPITGVITWPTPFTLGTIEVGNPKVKA
jgi:hypothetical protein